jgi:hypothetical protein
MLPRKSTTETSSLYFPTAFTPFEFSMMLFIPVLCILFTCGTVLVTCVLHREIRGKGERWSSAESFVEWDGADNGKRRRVVKKSGRPVWKIYVEEGRCEEVRGFEMVLKVVAYADV